MSHALATPGSLIVISAPALVRTYVHFLHLDLTCSRRWPVIALTFAVAARALLAGCSFLVFFNLDFRTMR
ncbi:MAG: hypothetical protein ACREFZ_06640 [Acetobacteraceae bacterium]